MKDKSNKMGVDYLAEKIERYAPIESKAKEGRGCDKAKRRMQGDLLPVLPPPYLSLLDSAVAPRLVSLCFLFERWERLRRRCPSPPMPFGCKRFRSCSSSISLPFCSQTISFRNVWWLASYIGSLSSCSQAYVVWVRFRALSPCVLRQNVLAESRPTTGESRSASAAG